MLRYQSPDDLVKQLRAEAADARACFRNLAIQAIAFISAIIGLAVPAMVKVPQAAFVGLGAILIAVSVQRIGIHKFTTANRLYGYQLHLERLGDAEASHFSRGIGWEEALRAWRIVQATVFAAIYESPPKDAPQLLADLSPNYYILKKRWQEQKPWWMQSARAEAAGGSYHAGSYLARIFGIFDVLQALCVALLLGAIGIDLGKGRYGPWDVIFGVSFVIATAFVFLTMRSIKRRRMMLENELLSIHSCAITWKAVARAHMLAWGDGPKGRLDYTERLTRIAKHLSNDPIAVRDWADDDQPLPFDPSSEDPPQSPGVPENAATPPANVETGGIPNEASSPPGTQQLIKSLRLLSSSALFSLATCFLVLKNSQIRDAVQIVVEEWDERRIHVLAGVLDLLLFSAAITFCGSFIIRNSKRIDFAGQKWLRVVVNGISILLGMLPGLALFWLCQEMQQDETSFTLGKLDPGIVQSHLLRLAWIAIAASIAGSSLSGIYIFGKKKLLLAFFYFGVIFTIALWLIGVYKFTTDPFAWGAMWGPLATFFAGMAFWLLIISLLVLASEKSNAPILWAYVILLCIVQGFNLQNTRRVPLVASPPRPNVADDVRAANDFRSWLLARPDYSPNSRDSYPVILVAAEGGGIRATALTALTMARLDEICGNAKFSDHVYCMSGVSGGSVGLGFYRALLDYDKDHPFSKPKSKQIEDLLSCDYLSAPLGRLFFTDGPFACVPFLSSSAFDRSAALSAAFRQAWAKQTEMWGVADDSLSEPLSHFSIDKGPNLLLNATSVTQHSPFAMTRINLDKTKYSLQSFGDTLDVRLADAMCLSSRFPGITTAGVLNQRLKDGNETDAFVDAGYFDNSGLDSLNRVLAGVADATVRWNLNVRVLILRIGSELEEPEDPAATDQGLNQPLPHGVDVLSPVFAAGNVYLSSVLNSDRKLFDDVDATRFRTYWSRLTMRSREPGFESISYAPIVLDHVNERDPEDQLPLGWIISRRSVEAISDEIGRLKDDYPPSLPSPHRKLLRGPAEIRKESQERMERNKYVLWMVRRWLKYSPGAKHALRDTGHEPTHRPQFDRNVDPPTITQPAVMSSTEARPRRMRHRGVLNPSH